MDDISYVVSRLLRTGSDIDNVEVFVYGSTRCREAPHSDIDLLVVYQTGRTVDGIRLTLEDVDLERPLDVMYISSCEERELDFIRRQECVKIFPTPPQK